MMSTIIAISLLLGGMLTSFLLWAVFLRLGLRWAKVKDVTRRQIAVATILVIVLNVAYLIVRHLVSRNMLDPDSELLIFDLGVSILIPCYAITQVFWQPSRQIPDLPNARR